MTGVQYVGVLPFMLSRNGFCGVESWIWDKFDFGCFVGNIFIKPNHALKFMYQNFAPQIFVIGVVKSYINTSIYFL